MTLSPEATAQATTPDTTAEPATEQPSPSAQKAAALLDALDADRDGAITKAEFIDGALALLGRRDDAGSESDQTVEELHGSHRLERRLKKLFKRVDTNHDGTLDASELASALKKAERHSGRHAGCGQDAAPASSESAPATTASFASVTVFAVAMKQYSAVSAAA